VTDAIETYRSIEPLAAEWEKLAVRVGASPFDRPGWFRCWLDAFGGAGLEVVALRRDGRLAAVTPVLWRRGVVRSPTNWHTPGFEPVGEDGEARRATFAALVERQPRRLDLTFLAHDCAAEVKAGWPRARSTERVVHSSPYVAIDGEWEAYWEGVSKNLRSNVRRRRKKLAALGEVEVEVVGEAVPADLIECFRLEALGWKGERGTAINSTPETLRFYTSLAEWGAEAGVLRLCLLRLDGRIIAFNYCLEAEGRHYLLKLGHDVELGDAGPGVVLTAAMVQRCFAERLRSYEFLGDPDRYKTQWESGRRELSRLQLFAPSLVGGADRFVQTRGRAAAIAVLRRG
jgi:CelD/BcsL family acetyltransferase involved in cellulose biosynthesis